jgi:hypothetical protein
VLSRVAVSDAVSVGAPSADGEIAMPEGSLSVDARGPDAESLGWIEALSGMGAAREDAVAAGV